MKKMEDYLRVMLYYFSSIEKNYNIQLRNCPDGNLIAHKRDGKYNYFQVTRQDGEYIRRGITTNKKLIQALCRKKYMEARLEAASHNIKILEKAADSLLSVEYDEIMKSLPAAYRTLPWEYFNGDSSQADGAKTDTWSSQPYRQSTYMPQHKRHTTSRGLKVRSKSELLIAEKLSEHGILFRYEQILEIGGIEYAPDFTILRPDGQQIYWEHCGLTSNTRYMSHHWQKMQAYSEAGILPWKNLIVTYDDEDGILDMAAVESEIKNKVMK